MAGAEQTKGLGFWPKVLLWAGVIAAGALYLGSINDQASRDERAAPVAESAAPADSGAAADSGAPAPAAGSEGASEASELVQTPADAAPTAAAEMAVTSGEPVASPAAASAPAADPTPLDQSVPLPDVQVIPVAATQAAVPGESAEVTPQEAEAFAKAVVSEPEQAPEQPGAAVQDEAAPAVSDPAAAAAPEVPAEEPPAVVVETMEERRARVMAEYESMRRRAEQEMQRRWQGMGMPSPGPGMMPYAGYPPGYYPQAPAQPQQP